LPCGAEVPIVVREVPAMSTNVVWHSATVTRQRREAQNGHKSVILWFTGLSGAGKSTIAHATEEALHRMLCHTFVFDGDNVRHGLCGDLDFSIDARRENIRRIGEMSKLFLEAGDRLYLAVPSRSGSRTGFGATWRLPGDLRQVLARSLRKPRRQRVVPPSARR
jgi:hypothetical protein